MKYEDFDIWNNFFNIELVDSGVDGVDGGFDYTDYDQVFSDDPVGVVSFEASDNLVDNISGLSNEELDFYIGNIDIMNYISSFNEVFGSNIDYRLAPSGTTLRSMMLDAIQLYNPVAFDLMLMVGGAVAGLSALQILWSALGATTVEAGILANYMVSKGTVAGS